MATTEEISKETKAKAGLSPVSRYLVMYNQISAFLWAIVLTKTVRLSLTVGQPEFFQSTNFSTTVIQSFAVIEILNSILGFVKSPVFTTVSQVSSRLLVVYGIFMVLPESPANGHWSYITLSLAWSITEIIRYSYYAQNIVTGGNPAKILTILRYNLFFVLYPLGVGSELAMIFLSLNEAEKVICVYYKYFLIGSMALYAPGFYILFTHMLKQRKRAMKALYAEKKEK